jgi:hypothetical protein
VLNRRSLGSRRLAQAPLFTAARGIIIRCE